MDATETERKKSGATKRPAYASLRIRRETRRRIAGALAAANKKDIGRRIRTDEYLELALSLVTAQHLEQLVESSLSHADRLERDYRAYVAKHGAISRDDYLGMRLSGEISCPTSNDNPLTT